MAGNKEVVVKPQPKRDTVLFARIQKVNKDFITKEAKKAGFSDEASYVDAVFDSLRGIDSLKRKR